MKAAVGVAISIVSVGAILYVLSFRDRRSLDVPIFSNTAKKMVGGVMIFLGLALVAYLFLKVNK